MESTDTTPIYSANFDLFYTLAQLGDGEYEEKRKLVEGYIQKWTDFNRIVASEFEPGLDWFNVTRPLEMKKDLRGKVVLLDFFTHCCVNCQHVLPDIAELERAYSVEDGFAVIGVHSPKFEQEKDPASVLNAVLRYDISHPVVNDADCKLWQMLFISCWPTLVLLGPSGQILFILMGEGHRTCLRGIIPICLQYFKVRGQISSHKLPILPEKDFLPKGMLSFPGKICLSEDGSLMAIADTGHHRMVIASNTGLVVDTIGSGKRGFLYGDFSTAMFSSPQGLAWSGDTIYVADTGNHAIRKIDLISRKVDTIAGNGEMGSDEEGGAMYLCQSLNSPWDVCLVNSGSSVEPDVLLIAMSGSHQIWMFVLRDGVKWPKRDETFPAGACVRVYGSGKEEHRNNMYAIKASFAQPSGLSYDSDKRVIYVADSESSSVRAISVAEGSVRNVVGASRDPTDLFTFGDVDGGAAEVRLQHPMAVAYSSERKLLYVADSYNHKIKEVHPIDRSSKTLAGGESAGDAVGDFSECRFDEPRGLTILEQEGRSVLFVADTNNHCIKALDLKNRRCIKIPLVHRPGMSPLIEASYAGKVATNPSIITININPLDILPGSPVEFNLVICVGELDSTTVRQQWKIRVSGSLHYTPLNSQYFANVLEHLIFRNPDGSHLQNHSGSLDGCIARPLFSMEMLSTFPERQIPISTLLLDLVVIYCDKKSRACVPKTLRFVVPLKRLLGKSKKAPSSTVDLPYFITF